MLYPDVGLSNVNRIFWHSLALIKEAVIAELPAVIVETDLEEWLPPNHLLNAGTLR